MYGKLMRTCSSTHVIPVFLDAPLGELFFHVVVDPVDGELIVQGTRGCPGLDVVGEIEDHAAGITVLSEVKDRFIRRLFGQAILSFVVSFEVVARVDDEIHSSDKEVGEVLIPFVAVIGASQKRVSERIDVLAEIKWYET